MIDIVAAGLFGRHVRGRARRAAAVSRRRDRMSQSEVENARALERAGRRALQPDVARFDVAVNESRSVRRGQSLRDLPTDGEYFWDVSGGSAFSRSSSVSPTRSGIARNGTSLTLSKS